MIHVMGDQEFYGKSATSFEAYMFATQDKFIVRHVNFDTFETGMMDANSTIIYPSGKNIATSERSKRLTEFNKLLKSHNISALSNANKLMMSLIYLYPADDAPDAEYNAYDYHNDYNKLCDILNSFTKSKDRVVGFTTHFAQLSGNDYSVFTYPHVHIIYDLNRKDRLDDYILSHI